MSLILSLESSTTVCSVALHTQGILIDSMFISEPRAASTQLMVEAKNILDKNSTTTKDLKAIAVSSGPGSYTGLRISTSAAKGLCYALNIPLISVNSLIILAYGVSKTNQANFYCPMLDARRMEIYTMVTDSSMTEISSIEAKVLSAESFQSFLNKGSVVFFGDGSVKFKPLVNHPNAFFVEGRHPEAKDLGVLAFKKFALQQFENIMHYEPMYLKDFMIKKSTKI